MKLTVAAYRRVHADTGLDNGEPLALVAHCEQSGDDVLVKWHDATLADMARLEFSDAERIGAGECIEQRFFENEREACRLAYVRQRVAAPHVLFNRLGTPLEGSL